MLVLRLHDCLEQVVLRLLGPHTRQCGFFTTGGLAVVQAMTCPYVFVIVVTHVFIAVAIMMHLGEGSKQSFMSTCCRAGNRIRA